MNNNPLQNARTVHAVGPQPKELRPVTKMIMGCIKLGLLGGALCIGWNVAGKSIVEKFSSDNTPQLTQVETPSVSEITAEGVSNIQANANAQAEMQNVVETDFRVYDKLKINVNTTDTAPELAVKLWRAGQAFQAAALQAEGLETKPYYIEGDPTQPTIGVGYNIKQSIGAIGRDGVRRELTSAGIDNRNIDLLMNRDKAVSSQAEINVPQALALLDVATQRFRDSTRHAVGASTFDRLPTHRQAALMWFDYNANIHRRPELVNHVRAGRIVDAIESMETSITVHGKRIRSPNMILAQSMLYSEDGLRQVIMDPSRLKRNAQNGVVLWGGERNSTPAETQVETSYASNQDISQSNHVVVRQGNQPSVQTVREMPQVPIGTNVRRVSGTEGEPVRNIQNRGSNQDNPNYYEYNPEEVKPNQETRRRWFESRRNNQEASDQRIENKNSI